MASHHLAIMRGLRPAVVRSAALIGAAPVVVAMALGIWVAVAYADHANGEPPPQADANLQRAAQSPPPARVILPAPWEQAAPARPVTPPAEPTNRR
ncbi:hypothetical protein H8A99_44815 [Bradyrhizobium sp. Arg68]|nr:hypothetical protein [Bradyrhizobium ivorense]